MRHVNASSLLKILVVTDDRALARQLSEFFDMMGYWVAQAADARCALAAVAAQAPQILLISADLASESDWKLCSALDSRAGGAGLFKFLLVQDSDEGLLGEALEAGIDDFLAQPICYGELMSRLRAAARVLEYDRRAAQQNRADTPTGLASRAALAVHLREHLNATKGKAARVACVALDVDFFSGAQRAHGATAAESLLKAVAAELSNLCSGSERLGCLGGARFCAILPGASDMVAAEWAENARRALAAAQFKLGDVAWQITASCGVAGCNSADAAEQLLDHATQALHTAKCSGRNCVVRYGEFNADEHELTEPGKLLQTTVARDIMTPCPLFLRADEPVSLAIDLFHRTKLDGIPVVDNRGKLLGLCEQDTVIVLPESDQNSRTVGEVMTTDAPTFGEEESFTTLLDFFSQDLRSLVLVTRDERPVGFITCNSLLAMSKPVTMDGLAADAKYVETSDFLLVPDVRPLECHDTT